MKTSVVIVSVIAILLIAGGLYVAFNKSALTGAVIQDTTQGKVITIQASRWSYTPGTITVKKGEHVTLMMNNTDKGHGIAIPDLGVSGIDSVEFTPDKAGTYEFHCPTFCGQGHQNMTGTLIVEE